MESRPASVLVIEDETPMRHVLDIGLTQRGFTVFAAADGSAGLQLLRREDVDVILLDVMLPTIDGIALIPMLRRTTEAPILMLSARSDVATKVAGLEAGADDYLAKPFDFNELAARLRSALRRPQLRTVESIAFADLELDLGRRIARRGATELSLTAREFDLLATMARTPQRVYTRRQLIELVWGETSDVSPGTIEGYVSSLRAKVDRTPWRPLIQTIRGVGYSVR
jgi:two-component system copper resistance phosphate regulon response regulator CusR